MDFNRTSLWINLVLVENKVSVRHMGLKGVINNIWGEKELSVVPVCI